MTLSLIRMFSTAELHSSGKLRHQVPVDFGEQPGNVFRIIARHRELDALRLFSDREFDYQIALRDLCRPGIPRLVHLILPERADVPDIIKLHRLVAERECFMQIKRPRDGVNFVMPDWECFDKFPGSGDVELTRCLKDGADYLNLQGLHVLRMGLSGSILEIDTAVHRRPLLGANEWLENEADSFIGSGKNVTELIIPFFSGYSGSCLSK